MGIKENIQIKKWLKYLHHPKNIILALEIQHYIIKEKL